MTQLALDSRRVSVLFAHRLSAYFDLPVDVYDERRDARSFINAGGGPVIAHPPCRLWSRMRGLSTAPESEKELAFFAVEQVRRFGGVLEHPAHSKLWRTAYLPLPGKHHCTPEFDEFGGWTLVVSQKWFGHRAEKMTWLYIVGCSPIDVPEMPLHLGEASHTCGYSRGARPRPECTKNERDLTPIAFAWWLEELASRCGAGQIQEPS